MSTDGYADRIGFCAERLGTVEEVTDGIVNRKS
jgi:hypothetical protein